MSSPVPAVATLENVEVTWPDGTTALDQVDLALPPGRSGLVGTNGSGKTTLLRVLATDLVPTGGRIHVTGSVEYLRQDVTWASRGTVTEFLGIATVLAALGRIDAGSVEVRDFEAVGEDWDIAERTTAALAWVERPAQTAGTASDPGVNGLSAADRTR